MNIDIVSDTFKTIIGFFIALLLNKLVDVLWRDKNRQKKVLQAIKFEALANCNICVESFMKYYKDGLVLNYFMVETAEKNITDPLFISNTKPEELMLLIDYLRNIKLANKYSEFVKQIKLSNDSKLTTMWDENAIKAWGACIDKCALSIKAILDLSVTSKKDNFFSALLKENKVKINYEALGVAVKF